MTWASPMLFTGSGNALLLAPICQFELKRARAVCLPCYAGRSVECVVVVGVGRAWGWARIVGAHRCGASATGRAHRAAGKRAQGSTPRQWPLLLQNLFSEQHRTALCEPQLYRALGWLRRCKHERAVDWWKVATPLHSGETSQRKEDGYREWLGDRCIGKAGEVIFASKSVATKVRGREDGEAGRCIGKGQRE